jgi:hypothetical protein
MDKVMKISLGLFIIILVAFASVLSYNFYVENSYRSSLTGTFVYNLTITTDSKLTNLTLFVPVPEDMTGGSPIVSEYSAKGIEGVPPTWTTELFDAGKGTMVKITAPLIVPPAGSTAPYSVTLFAALSANEAVETAHPVEQGVMFRPVQSLQTVDCKGAPGQCYQFTTPLYADYSASPNATVSISSYLTGLNSWTVFSSHSNEFNSDIGILLAGANHGWVTAKGNLETGIGSYDAPQLSS